MAKLTKNVTPAPQPAPTVTYTLELSQDEADILATLLGCMRWGNGITTPIFHELADAGAQHGVSARHRPAIEGLIRTAPCVRF